jgi:RND family efflux transporter MFP subunit
MTVSKLREKNDTQHPESTVHEDATIDTKAKLRKNPFIGILQVGGVIALLALAIFYSRAPSQLDTLPPTQNLAGAASSPDPLVSVVMPILSSGQLSVTSTGSVAVRSYVTLASQVSGRVIETSLSLRSGGSFVAGETLVTLEPRDFILALAQVQADVTSAQASLQLSQAEASVAISNFRILNPVREVPPLVAKEPQIAQAKAQLQGAIARRDIQQTNLERSVYSLPFSGRVVESSADEGQILNAGQSFGRVYALDAVEIVISLSPKELAKIVPVEKRLATITADGATFEGQIQRVAAERNPQSRFSQVFLTANNTQSLIPGTFVSVTINGPITNNTFMLPESALQVGEVFWIVKNGTIAEVSATILGRSSGQYLVESFEYGDGIVTGSVPGGGVGLSVRLAQAN